MVWNAIMGMEGDGVDMFAEAVRDTAPVEHAATLAMDDVAAAYAFDIMWAPHHHLPANADAFEYRDVARELWSRFAERASRTAELAHGFGWDLSAAWTQTREVQLAHGDMVQVERVARLAGRMHVALRGHMARRVVGMPEEVYSVTQGNDVARLLPSELVLFSEPLLELVVLERLATRRAAQYAVRGSARATKGPLVLVLDESSSMAGARSTWAKAAAVALSRIAMRERRPAAVVHFSSSAVPRMLPPNDAAAVTALVRHFLGGGTAIGLALHVGVEQVVTLAGRGKNGADIVVISDGVDRDTDAHDRSVAEMARVGARLWTIAIECDIDEASSLRSRAASYCRLGAHQMSDPESVTLLTGAL